MRDFGPETKNAIEYADEEDSDQVYAGRTANTQEYSVGDLNNPRVREFEGCARDSTECIIKDQN